MTIRKILLVCVLIGFFVSAQAQVVKIKASDGAKKNLQLAFDNQTGNFIVVWENGGRIFGNVLKPKSATKFKSKKESEYSEGSENRRPTIALLPGNKLFLVAWDTGPDDLISLVTGAAVAPSATGADIKFRSVKPKNAKPKGDLITAVSDGNMNVMPQLVDARIDDPEGSDPSFALLFWIQRDADGTAKGVGPAKGNDFRHYTKADRFGIGSDSTLGGIGGLSARFQVAKNFGIQGIASFAQVQFDVNEDKIEDATPGMLNYTASSVRGDIGFSFSNNTDLSIALGADYNTTPEEFSNVDTHSSDSASFSIEGPTLFMWGEGRFAVQGVWQHNSFGEVRDDEGDSQSGVIQFGPTFRTSSFSEARWYYYGPPNENIVAPGADENRVWIALARPNNSIELVEVSSNGSTSAPKKIVTGRKPITEMKLFILPDPLRALVVWIEKVGNNSFMYVAVKAL